MTSSASSSRRWPDPRRRPGSPAASFAVGAGLALLTAAVAPSDLRIAVIAIVTIILLALLGTFGARLGGAPPLRGAIRITIGGGIAMVATALIGLAVGTFT